MHVTIAGSLLSRAFNSDQLSRVTIELAAFDGEIGTGALPIDDPTAVDDYRGGRQARIDEIDTLLVDGFIGDQDRIRGPVPVTDREVVHSVQDPNVLLFAKRAVRSRPVETDVARVLAFAALDLSGVDTTWVLVANTSSMAAKRYDGEGWAELISDTVELTGKTLFIHDKSLGGRCLHYHRLVDGHTCGLSISDAVTTNGPTVWIPGSPQKKTSPAELGNDIRFVDQAGRTSLYTDATSITNHDADGLAHQKIIRVEATSQSHLDAIAASQGPELRFERFTWVCTIGPLDATALSLIRVGDLITTTSQVMGLSATAKRIAHMTLTMSRDTAGDPVPGLWDATLELGAPIRRAWPAKGKSAPKVSQASLPPTVAWGADIIEVQTFADREVHSRVVERYTDTTPFTNDTVPGVFGGNYAEILESSSAGVASDKDFRCTFDHLAPAGATSARLTTRVGAVCTRTTAGAKNTAHWAIYQATYGAAEAAYSAINPTPLVTGTANYGENVNSEYAAELTDVDIEMTIVDGRVQWMLAYDNTLQTQVNTENVTTSALSIENRVPGFPIVGGNVFAAQDKVQFQRPDVPMPANPLLAVDADGTIYYHLTFYGGAGEPQLGQWVALEDAGTGDGTTTAFTTRFPYSPGSLRVYVDGIRESHITETGSGTFTFSTAPFAGETIKVQYIR